MLFVHLGWDSGFSEGRSRGRGDLHLSLASGGEGDIDAESGQ